MTPATSTIASAAGPASNHRESEFHERSVGCTGGGGGVGPARLSLKARASAKKIYDPNKGPVQMAIQGSKEPGSARARGNQGAFAQRARRLEGDAAAAAAAQVKLVCRNKGRGPRWCCRLLVPRPLARKQSGGGPWGPAFFRESCERSGARHGGVEKIECLKAGPNIALTSLLVRRRGPRGHSPCGPGSPAGQVGPARGGSAATTTSLSRSLRTFDTPGRHLPL